MLYGIHKNKFELCLIVNLESLIDFKQRDDMMACILENRAGQKLLISEAERQDIIEILQRSRNPALSYLGDRRAQTIVEGFWEQNLDRMLRVKMTQKSWCPAWFIEWMVVLFLKIRSTRGRLDCGVGETDNEFNA